MNSKLEMIFGGLLQDNMMYRLDHLVLGILVLHKAHNLLVQQNSDRDAFALSLGEYFNHTLIRIWS